MLQCVRWKQQRTHSSILSLPDSLRDNERGYIDHKQAHSVEAEESRLFRATRRLISPSSNGGEEESGYIETVHHPPLKLDREFQFLFHAWRNNVCFRLFQLRIFTMDGRMLNGRIFDVANFFQFGELHHWPIRRGPGQKKAIAVDDWEPCACRQFYCFIRALRPRPIYLLYELTDGILSIRSIDFREEERGKRTCYTHLRRVKKSLEEF